MWLKVRKLLARLIEYIAMPFFIVAILLVFLSLTIHDNGQSMDREPTMVEIVVGVLGLIAMVLAVIYAAVT